MEKLLSKFKVIVPALVCLLALTMVLFAGCKGDVPAHTHSMTLVEGTAATCTQTGVKAHYHCSTCEKDFLTKEGTEEVSAESLSLAIDPQNHNYTKDGQTNYVYDYENDRYVAACTRCGHQDATQTAGTEQYPYLAKDEATFAAVITKGGYVKLQNDITITSACTIEKETHLDLNGKTLKSTASLLRYTNGSNNSTIVGNRADSSQKGYLTIECDKNDPSNKDIKIFSLFDNYNPTKLTITNVDMTSSVAGITLFENSSITLDNCKLIVEKGIAISTNNQWSASAEDGMNVIIKDSEIISKEDSAIYIPGYMNLTVENSSITGCTSAIHALMGNINVDTSSTLHATKKDFVHRADKETVEASGSGSAEWDGAALIIRTNYYYNQTDVNADGTGIENSSRYAVGNKLTLNIADWSNVTSASNVKAVVYNWTVDSSHIADAKNAGLTITNQFVEVLDKLGDKDGVKFYKYDGNAVNEYTQQELTGNNQ